MKAGSSVLASTCWPSMDWPYREANGERKRLGERWTYADSRRGVSTVNSHMDRIQVYYLKQIPLDLSTTQQRSSMCKLSTENVSFFVLKNALRAGAALLPEK